MGQPVVAVVCLLPVFWLAVLVPIWGNDLPLELYGVHIERVVVPNCAEPNVLCVVLPVRFRASTFLALPCDPVTNMEMPVQNWKDQRGCSPIATNVHRGFWSE